MGDSFNKGVIEHDKSSNIVDSHNNHEQPGSQLTKHAFRHSNFYKSHDRGNMINRNLEHLLTPQPSVPHRTAQERGHSTERPASVANSHQNHFSTTGNLATKISMFSPKLPLPYSITQSVFTTKTISSSTVFTLECTTTIHFNKCSIFNNTISHILGTASLPTLVNNRGVFKAATLVQLFLCC